MSRWSELMPLRASRYRSESMIPLPLAAHPPPPSLPQIVRYPLCKWAQRWRLLHQPQQTRALPCRSQRSTGREYRAHWPRDAPIDARSSIGVLLAIGSGALIGSSFVFKKKGLLSSQKGHVAGEGVAYLKSASRLSCVRQDLMLNNTLPSMQPMWWTGMIIMILGELCNFAAYAFVEAIIVVSPQLPHYVERPADMRIQTPMGALSVVISSLLSHFVLDEKLSLFGWIASVQCLIGSSILALNGPEEQSVNTIDGFRDLFVTPWFLSYAGVLIVAAIVLAVWVAPKYGKKSMLPCQYTVAPYVHVADKCADIGICSLIGGISVTCTQGLGACILTSIRGQNQVSRSSLITIFYLLSQHLVQELVHLLPHDLSRNHSVYVKADPLWTMC